jgi:hypothetical protein
MLTGLICVITGVFSTHIELRGDIKAFLLFSSALLFGKCRFICYFPGSLRSMRGYGKRKRSPVLNVHNNAVALRNLVLYDSLLKLFSRVVLYCLVDSQSQASVLGVIILFV